MNGSGNCSDSLPDESVERVRGEHPPGDSWRADALGASRHTRLLDELTEPTDDPDPERAAATCAAVCRAVLADWVPGLAFVEPSERRRFQALGAYTLTLFDFARQSGLEGERLSQMNRWEFELDAALGGEPRGQPVFVRLASEDRRRKWNRRDLDAIAAAARSRVAHRRPATPEAREREAARLATAVVRAATGAGSPALEVLVAACLRVHSLVHLGTDLERASVRLPVTEFPEGHATEAPQLVLADAVELEIARIRRLLRNARRSEPVPEPYRRLAGYLNAAAVRLLDAVEARGASLPADPPSLGLGARLACLAVARFAPGF